MYIYCMYIIRYTQYVCAYVCSFFIPICLPSAYPIPVDLYIE